MSQLTSSPSYLGDPTSFSFPKLAKPKHEHASSVSSSAIIERAGSVLIKSGFNKVPSFNTPIDASSTLPSPAFLDTPVMAHTPKMVQQIIDDDLSNFQSPATPMSPTFTPPRGNFEHENESGDSLSSMGSYNAEVCAVHNVIGVIQKGDLTTHSYDQSNSMIQNDDTVIINPYSGKEELADFNEQHDEEYEVEQLPLTDSVDQTQESLPKDILDDILQDEIEAETEPTHVTSEKELDVVSILTQNTKLSIKRNQSLAKSEYYPPVSQLGSEISSLSSKALDEEKEPSDWEEYNTTIDTTNMEVSQDNDLDDVSIVDIPRRSSKRMRIYQKLGVEPNGKTLLEYVSSQRSLPMSTIGETVTINSFNSADKTIRASRKSIQLDTHMDNLTKMMKELEDYQFESISDEENMHEKLILDSQSTASLNNIRSRGSIRSSLKNQKDDISPLKGKTNYNNNPQLTALNSLGSILRKKSNKRARSLPSVPDAKKDTGCELKRSKAIKRRTGFVSSINKILKAGYSKTVKGLRNIKVGGRKLFKFATTKFKRNYSQKKVKSLTIGLPSELNIEDTGIKSTFGTLKNVQHLDDLPLETVPESDSDDDVPLSELQLSVKSVSLSEMTMDSTKSLGDFWAMTLNNQSNAQVQLTEETVLDTVGKSHNRMKSTMDQTTLNTNMALNLNYDDHAEVLLNQFLKYDQSSNGTSISTGEIYSDCDSACGSSCFHSGEDNASSSSQSHCSDSDCCSSCIQYDSEDAASYHSPAASVAALSNRSSLKRSGLRPSMKMTSLNDILKEQRAASAWRPRLIGPRPIPEEEVYTY